MANVAKKSYINIDTRDYHKSFNTVYLEMEVI